MSVLCAVAAIRSAICRNDEEGVVCVPKMRFKQFPAKIKSTIYQVRFPSGKSKKSI